MVKLKKSVVTKKIITGPDEIEKMGYMKVPYLEVKERGAPDASCLDLWLESL